MAQLVSFQIDGKECMAEEGEYLISAAKRNHVYIPTLCNYQGVPPQGSCRVCSVKVNGKLMTACTTRVANGMEIENDTEELAELRRSIVELLFAEGNHLCPACEQSGNCELQALAYRLRVLAPRFPFLYPQRDVEASNPKLLKDHNRCILCKRCIRAIRDGQGRRLFAFGRRGGGIVISIDTKLAQNISDELADRAAAVCPVGAIVRKERGFTTPIGRRTYDRSPIGTEIEQAE